MSLEQADIEGGMANLLGENVSSEEVVNEEVVSEEVVDETIVDEEVVSEEVVEDDFNLDFEGFNKKYGTELTEDGFEDFISNAKGYNEVSAKNTELQQKLDEQRLLIDEGFDPLKHFASEEDYITQQVKKKFPGVNQGVLSQITPSKIDEMSNWDVLVKNTLVNSPGLEGGEAGVEEMLKAKYNIDEDTPMEEWTQLQRNSVAMDAIPAKASLKSMYDDIKVPDKIDFEAIRANRIETWKEPLRATVEGINELKVTEDFTFEVTPDMKQGLQDQVMNEALRNYGDLSEESLRKVAGSVRDRLIISNIDKIAKGLEAAAMEKAKAEFRKKVHNDTSLNNDVRSERGELSDEEAGMNYLTGQ